MATAQVQQALKKRLCEPLVKTGPEMKKALAGRVDAIRSVDATTPDVLPNIPLLVTLATLISLGMVLLGSWRRGTTVATAEALEQEIPRDYFSAVIQCTLVIIVYLACLGWGPVDFRILTFLFIAVIIFLIRHRSESGFRWQGFPWDLCLVVPLLCHVVFHVLFQIELP